MKLTYCKFVTGNRNQTHYRRFTMRVLLTGSAGRIGRAIYNALIAQHDVVGIDQIPSSTTHIVADFANLSLLTRALEGIDAVIHTAALHAPHVGIRPDAEFERINVDGTRLLVEAARSMGVNRLVFTSTTALFGRTAEAGVAAWVTDETTPRPRTIYHRTKLAAEAILWEAADDRFHVRVIRMSRCFPETADLMAVYRLCRGIDVRDVATAHVAALSNEGVPYQQYIVSGKTPFKPDDCALLAHEPATVLRERVPDLLLAFRERDWPLPASIDRVYAGTQAYTGLNWQPRYGFREVVAQLDRASLEVLPVS